MANTDPRTDVQLLRDSRRSAEAFGTFFDRHGSDVLAYFLRRTTNIALAEDLTSETFAQAYANRRRYRDTGHPATAWLFTIAARQLNEFFRQERVSRKYRDRIGVASQTSSDDFDRVDDLDAVRRRLPQLETALSQLTTASAEAVSLRVGHGWTYQRLAEHLDCTPATARVRVSRALHLLEQQLTTEPS